MRILFVCSSNVCRSPYCEFVFRRMVNANPVLNKNIEWIRSAAVFNHSKKLHSKARLALLNEGFSSRELDLHKPAYKKVINIFLKRRIS